MLTEDGPLRIDMPRDRDGSFEPVADSQARAPLQGPEDVRHARHPDRRDRWPVGYQQVSDGTATTVRVGSTAISHTWHDANGFISNIAETNPDGTPTFKDLRFDRAFVNDAQGNALYVNQAAGRTGRIQNGPGGYLGGSVGDSMDPGHVQRQLVANGEVLGRYGDAFDHVNSSPQAEVLKYVHSTDFQMEAQVLNLKGASVDPVAYTVVGGETLRDVARNVLGDASLWWRIADANALAVSADAPLTAGQTLSVPKLALNANNAETFQPYDPSKITGSMDPTLPMPAQKERCGGFGQVIMAVVAVAVAIWAPQFLTQMGATGLFGSGGTLTALGGAVGGAAGSIASQVVGNVIGVQDGFSWKGVALGALAGGISAGLAGTELLGGTGWQITAVRMATANALTQGVAVATGLQKSFDWKGVAASAVGAGVGAAVGEALSGYSLPEGMAGPQTPAAFSGLGDFGGALARGTISGFAAGTAAAIARGGKVAIQQVAMDAFGNALGQSLAVNMDSQPSIQSSRTDSNSAQSQIAPSLANGADPIAQAYDYSQRNPNSGVPFSDALNYFGDKEAARYLPSLIPDPQLVGAGKTNSGLSYFDWDSGARATQVVQRTVNGTSLPPLAEFQDTLQIMRASSQSYYSDAELNASSPAGAIAARWSRIASDGFYENLQSLPNLAKVVLDDKARHMALAQGLYALTNPIETATNIAAGSANYLRTSSWEKISEDALRSVVVGGVLSRGVGQGVSAVGNLVSDAMSVERIANKIGATEAQALSRGEELRQKYGHLSVDERRAIIWERTEEIARQQLESMESSKYNAHFMSRHSPQIDLYDQVVSAATGMRPDGKIMGGPTNRYAVDSTQFLSNKDMLYGINRAERIQQHAISTGNPITDYISLRFDYPVGEGFIKGTPLFGANLAGFYRQTKFASFFIDPTTARAITAFPVISSKVLGILY